MRSIKGFFRRLGWTLVVSALLMVATFCVFFLLGVLFQRLVPEYAWVCNIVTAGACIFVLVWIEIGKGGEDD